MSKLFFDIMQGFKEFSDATNDDDLKSKIKSSIDKIKEENLEESLNSSNADRIYYMLGSVDGFPNTIYYVNAYDKQEADEILTKKYPGIKLSGYNPIDYEDFKEFIYDHPVEAKDIIYKDDIKKPLPKYAYYNDFPDGESPFDSFEELSIEASNYNLNTKDEGRNWEISGLRDNLEKFLLKFYNEDQVRYHMHLMGESIENKNSKSLSDLLLANLEESLNSDLSTIMKEVESSINKKAGVVVVDKEYEGDVGEYLTQKGISYMKDDSVEGKIKFSLNYNKMNESFRDEWDKLRKSKSTNDIIYEVLRDAEDDYKKLPGDESIDYCIGATMNAYGIDFFKHYHLFFEDYIGPGDKEYEDAKRGWFDNAGEETFNYSVNESLQAFSDEQQKAYERLNKILGQSNIFKGKYLPRKSIDGSNKISLSMDGKDFININKNGSFEILKDGKATGIIDDIDDFSDNEIGVILKKELSITESFNNKSLTEDMLRKEMIDYLDDHWNNNSENADKLYKAVEDVIGIDINDLDDSYEEEGFYYNLSDENLKEIISILKGESNKPGLEDQLDNIEDALMKVGTVRDTTKEFYASSAARIIDLSIPGGDAFRIQIYKR